MILAELGKFIGGKVATALIFVAMAGGAFWCYQHPEALQAGWHVVKLSLLWVTVAAALPWSSYLFMQPFIARQARLASAQAAGAMGLTVIAAYCAADVGFALYLAGGGIVGTFSWCVVILGFVAAAVYNFVICESLARQVDR